MRVNCVVVYWTISIIALNPKGCDDHIYTYTYARGFTHVYNNG